MFSNAGRFDLAHYYSVITTWVCVHNAAFYVGKRPVQKWRSADAPTVAGSDKTIFILRGKQSRDVLLIFGQNIDCEVTALSQVVVERGAFVYARKN